MKNECAVIVPIFKTELNELEVISLNRCFEVLSEFPIIGVKPFGLKVTLPYSNYSFTKFESFENAYFEDVQGYNRLMLSEEFYQRFISFNYILIYQLDCFVFKNSLSEWCNKGYDYIGAPWLSVYRSPDFIKSLKEKIKRRYYIYRDIKDKVNPNLPHQIQFSNTVGNGGFSLRKVEKFLNACTTYKEKISCYNAYTHHSFNEDVFFSIELNRKSKVLKIPNYKIACAFALENAPDIGFAINKEILPFGCHDWDEYKDFWRIHLAKFGYKI